MGKGFTLIEILVATSVAALLLLIILLSTIYIHKISFSLYKKYEISSKSKLLLSRIAKELARNNPPASNKNPIISIETNKIEFYSSRIVGNSPMVTKVQLIVYSNPINRGVSYTLAKREINTQNNGIIDQSVSSFFIESQLSQFRFHNLENVAVRLYLRNVFIVRGQQYEIYYKLDVPVNL